MPLYMQQCCGSENNPTFLVKSGIICLFLRRFVIIDRICAFCVPVLLF